MVSIFYEGKAPGQADRISVRGFLFVRGEFLAVPEELASRLLSRPGFYLERPAEPKPEPKSEPEPKQENEHYELYDVIEEF